MMEIPDIFYEEFYEDAGLRRDRYVSALKKMDAAHIQRFGEDIMGYAVMANLDIDTENIEIAMYNITRSADPKKNISDIEMLAEQFSNLHVENPEDIELQKRVDSYLDS